jgi:hypothetical protein
VGTIRKARVIGRAARKKKFDRPLKGDGNFGGT